MAKEKDYKALLAKDAIHITDLDKIELSEIDNEHAFNVDQRHTAYSLNQESFKFLLDPILSNGLEKVTAMGYGITPNALSKAEGGMSRYFSQRFAQVTKVCFFNWIFRAFGNALPNKMFNVVGAQYYFCI